MKKKIIFKILFFWIICFSIYWCSFEYIFLPYLHPAGIRAKIKSDYNKKQIPEEVDYLILGDSSALYSINPLYLSDKSHSAAELGASVARSKQVFLNLKLKKINKGVILIQTFIDAHYNEDIWKIFVPQKMMNSSDVLAMFCGNDFQDCSYWEQLFYRSKYFWYRLHINEYAANVFSYGIRFQMWQDNTRFIEFMKRVVTNNRGHYAAITLPKLENAEFFGAYYKFFKQPISPLQSEIDELNKLAEHVATYNIKLYIVFPQFYRNEQAMTMQKYDQSYSQFVSAFKKDNVRIITDNQVQAQYERRHFRDYGHLNEDGARVFTKKLVPILEQASQ